MKKKYTKTELTLALDWAHGSVSHAQVARKLKKSSVGAYVALALMLREIVGGRGLG